MKAVLTKKIMKILSKDFLMNYLEMIPISWRNYRNERSDYKTKSNAVKRINRVEGLFDV